MGVERIKQNPISSIEKETGGLGGDEVGEKGYEGKMVVWGRGKVANSQRCG